MNKESGDNPSDQEEGGLDYSGDLDPEEDLGQSFDQYSQFTPLEEELFKTRYENGYDLFIDPNYVSWLAMNHPEALPEDLRQSPNLSDNEMETDTPLLSGDHVTPTLEQANVFETDLTTDSTSTKVSHNGATPSGNGTSPNRSASDAAKSPACVTKTTTPSTTTVTPSETATTSYKRNTLPSSSVKTPAQFSS